MPDSQTNSQSDPNAASQATDQTKPGAMTQGHALAEIVRLTRYPVKSLTPQDLDQVALTPGQCLPHDRLYAIAHGAAQFDHANPGWVAKRNFAVLAKHDQLATMVTDYDPATEHLKLSRQGKVVAQGDLKTPAGRAVIEQFLNAYLNTKVPKPVKLVRVPDDDALTDQADPLISIINLATLRDLERVMDAPIDPRRFRGNILVDTGEAWSERQWVGQTIKLGDQVEAQVTDHIDRCAAINVDPDTAEKDMNIPAKLVRTFNHMDCGVFIEITQGGDVAVGDGISFS